MKKTLRIAAPWLLLIALVAAAIVVPLLTKPAPLPKELSLVEEAWYAILNDYVDKESIDLKVLSSGAIKGMLEAVNDPYTDYFNADEYELIKNLNIEGSYGGIGASVSIDDGQIIVVTPFKDTPAERAGIKPKDSILEINGESTEGMSLDKAALKIMGEPGTQVTLMVLHKGEEEPVTLVITREEIDLPSVYSEILPDNIAHIEITRFTSRTGSEFISALEAALDQDVAGVILDLRDNTGGVVISAVTVTSQFLKDGVVLYTVDSEGGKQEWGVESGGIATDLPLAILVNENSASGSEVVAGALQDYERGPLVGTLTFGKGSVNHFRQLSDGSAIYITIGRWETPDGRLIEGQGLSPDIEVGLTDEDIQQGKDPQLDKAIEYIKSQL